MTAEIGVMNRLGVALAADSAVSIGGEARKVYSSADKLFQLSTSAPVGIMVYGSATFLDRPWETIVKAARRRLGDRTFGRLEQYGDFFLEYLNEGAPVFSDAAELQAVTGLCEALLLHVRGEIEDVCTQRAEQQDGLTDSDVTEIGDEVVGKRLAAIKQRSHLPAFTEEHSTKARIDYKDMIERLMVEVFGELPLSEDARDGLHSCSCEMLVRSYVAPYVAGIVIAGFGEDEYEPEVVNYEVEERCLGKVRLSITKRHELGQGRSLIVPFAQRDAVSAFLEGVEPRLQAEMKESVEVLFHGAAAALIDKVRSSTPELGEELQQAVLPGLDEMLGRLFAGWQLMRRQMWGPILDMVAALPKDELAAVAESLVNLTKFRRRVTPVSESVGGPIDVALITKGDGFVWIKRKHYFPLDLNPRVTHRLITGG